MKASSNIKKHKLMKSGEYVILDIYGSFKEVDCCMCYRCNSLNPPLTLKFWEFVIQEQSYSLCLEHIFLRLTEFQL